MLHKRKTAIIALTVMAMTQLTGTALARPDTRSMSCDGAKAFVRNHGGVVMSTGQHTYERIVSGVGFCGAGEETALKVAPTSDNPKCWVGYYCRDRLIEPIIRFQQFR